MRWMPGIPYPHHKDQHQYHNAKEMMDTGGAKILEESAFSPEQFEGTLVKLLLDPSLITAMGECARRTGKLGGAEMIIDRIQLDIEGARN